jgi:hypothetical protein
MIQNLWHHDQLIVILSHVQKIINYCAVPLLHITEPITISSAKGASRQQSEINN